MREWQGHVIAAIVSIIIGIAMYLWAISIEIPAPYKTFLGIPYGVNPQYYSRADQMVTLLLFGLFFWGIGSGLLFGTPSVYRLEKKIDGYEKPVTEMVYCSYCGTRNVKDAVYCKKCGKKIS